MKKKMPVETEDLQEGLMTTVIHLDTMLSLLIDKGICTEEDYYSRLSKVREHYRKILLKKLPFWNIPTLLGKLDRLGSARDVAFLSTAIPETAKTVRKDIPQGISELRRLARTTVNEGGKMLPCNIRNMDGRMVCDDPKSAKKICASCIAQNMELLPSLGVRDICILPEMMKKMKLPAPNALKGVNPECWMTLITEKILEAVREEKISREDIGQTMIKSAENADLALEQGIMPEGILSIIDCAILEAHPEDLFPPDTEERKKGDGDFGDIDWRH